MLNSFEEYAEIMKIDRSHPYWDAFNAVWRMARMPDVIDQALQNISSGLEPVPSNTYQRRVADDDFDGDALCYHDSSSGWSKSNQELDKELEKSNQELEDLVASTGTNARLQRMAAEGISEESVSEHLQDLDHEQDKERK